MRSDRLRLLDILDAIDVVAAYLPTDRTLFSDQNDGSSCLFFLMHEPPAKTVARKLLGAALVFAGVSHLTFGREEFQAQVPDTVTTLSPLNKDQVVLLSGIAEIALGTTIALVGPAHQKAVGRFAAVFFTAVFPGNVAQYLNRRDAFGLNTDAKRFGRLFLQPLLVLWALKSS